MLISNNSPFSEILGRTLTNVGKVVFISTLTYAINVNLLGGSSDFPETVPAVLGTALAFFIGFKNNQAYNRWWEARIVWGEITNDSRSFTRMILTQVNLPKNNTSLSTDDLQVLKKRIVYRHIAFLYLLKDFLREQNQYYYLNYISASEYITYIENSTNKQNRVLELQSKEIEFLYTNQIIDGFKFLELNKMLTNFTNLMGKSERIKATVFPTTYRYYNRLFTWLFIISTTLVISENAGKWAILYASLLGYIFITLQQLGHALLDPFDNEPTSIALNQITRNIERNLLEMLGETNLPEPEPIIDSNYVM